MDRRFLGRAYRRIIHKYFLNDVLLDLRLQAKREAVDYIRANLAGAMLLADRRALMDYALGIAEKSVPGGLICEFGVAGGKTIRQIAGRVKGPVHGFDSFEGLPENWSGTAEQAGRFSQGGKPPRAPANVAFHVGWFDATVPPFLAAHPGSAALLHLDADLYSSTKTVLDLFAERIVPGTVLVFDEYLNYPGWREHEHKAFQEFIGASRHAYRYLGFSGYQGQAAVQIVAA